MRERVDLAPRSISPQLDDNLLFRWFVGLSMDDEVWDATVFTKNRARLLQGDVAGAFFEAGPRRRPRRLELRLHCGGLRPGPDADSPGSERVGAKPGTPRPEAGHGDAPTCAGAPRTPFEATGPFAPNPRRGAMTRLRPLASRVDRRSFASC